ncbi:MAG: GNAT family N-acetyltransferase [Candidatus Thermoplasmatota archaeon]
MQKNDAAVSDMKVIPVAGYKQFKNFYTLVFNIYKDDQYWVAPFWSELKSFFKTKNPFWTHAKTQLFIAYEKGEPVGRIAAIIDELYQEENKKVGYFGFFECINDYRVAESLFTAAEHWLKSHGVTHMRGPINGRIDVGCGFLYQGFNQSPFILGSYSPPYYIDFADRYGMQKCRDLVSYYLDLTKPIPPSVKEVAEQVEKNNVTIRGFNRLHAGRELNWWIPLMMEQFSQHWGYVNVPEQEVRTRFGVKQARWFVDSKLFLIAEIDGKPISFKWSTPNYNQIFKKFKGKLGPIQIVQFFLMKRKITEGKFNFVGIKKEYRIKGIGTFMNYYTMLEMQRRGYTGAECGWIDEENIASRKAIEKIGAQLYKIFRVYEKKIC